MEITIYTLEDPITNQIRYVGITSSTIKERLQNHIKNTKYRKRQTQSGKDRWILDLLSKNLLPIITEIEVVNDHYNYVEEVLEIYWIWQFKSWGFDLLNIQGLITDYSKMPKTARYKTPMNQYDLDGNFIQRFESVSLATKAVNGHGATIQRAARIKKGWKAYGFMWRYDKDADFSINNAISKGLPNKNKAVMQFKNNKLVKIWESGQEAALSLNLLKSKISNCCTKKRKSHGGYTWEFKDK